MEDGEWRRRRQGDVKDVEGRKGRSGHQGHRGRDVKDVEDVEDVNVQCSGRCPEVQGGQLWNRPLGVYTLQEFN